ncbi:unnamed protein product [Pocillopora meandrina]|uniref:SUEL-type lectin domain-containing protein n=1 Tax=Pocillopora meandrina TaxID=46732 RepID=A0AAU9VT99_9CNID|nr:unnamed protein product [Pocillopora meandrina]
MSAGRCWIFLLSLASTVTGFTEVRAEIDRRIVRSTYVCENDVMHLNCSPKVLRIEGADFGESSASICTKGEVSSQRCNLLEVTNILKTACDNKKNCSITALEKIFGDPCKGVNVSKQRSSSAYLNVLFACVKPVSSRKSTTSKTTFAQPTTFISTAENNSVNATNSTAPPMNSTAAANNTHTLPLTTTKPKTKSDKEIPVFDPSVSVYLGALSGSMHVPSFSSLGLLAWISIFSFFILGIINSYC